MLIHLPCLNVLFCKICTNFAFLFFSVLSYCKDMIYIGVTYFLLPFVPFRSMQWNEGKGVLLMHEVLGKSVLVHKPGSLECGQGWQNVADNLNSLDEFRVNGRGIRDCIMNLIKKYRVKINKEKNEAGVVV